MGVIEKGQEKAGAETHGYMTLWPAGGVRTGFSKRDWESSESMMQILASLQVIAQPRLSAVEYAFPD
jgi:hypothetical protein